MEVKKQIWKKKRYRERDVDVLKCVCCDQYAQSEEPCCKFQVHPHLFQVEDVILSTRKSRVKGNLGAHGEVVLPSKCHLKTERLYCDTFRTTKDRS